MKRQSTQHSADRYFHKKLHTQSLSMSGYRDFQYLSKKIQLAVKNAQQQSLSNHKKMIDTQHRKQQIQKRSMDSRSSLRSHLQQKMRSSQINITKINEKKKIQRQKRHKLEQHTRQKIKSMEKQFLQDSFRKSVNESSQTKKFFNEKLKRQKSKNQKLQNFYKSQIETKTSPKSFNNVRNNTHLTMPQFKNMSRKKSPPSFLKISQYDLEKHNNKKNIIQDEKFSKNLAQYIQKMNQISNVKLKNTKKQFIPKPTFPKIIKDPLERDQKSERYHKRLNNINSPTKAAIYNRVSFSDMYNKKLKEKKERIQLLHEISLREGDEITYKEKIIGQKNKQYKLIKETVNQVKRKCHFNYMKMLLKR